MPNTQGSIERVAIILNSPNDWDEWIEIAKTNATGNKMWDYVNPSRTKDDLPTLTGDMNALYGSPD